MMIYLYIKENCPLCDDTDQLIQLFHDEFDFILKKRDIYFNEDWLEKYHLEIPVLEIEDTILYGNDLNYDILQKTFNKYVPKK